MKFHEAANIFPLMEGEEYESLKADIKKNGLQVPIEVFDNQIIDGRNRYNACIEVGVSKKMVVITTNDPVQYVLSRNLHRRHLTASQKAMIGAKAREIYERQAKERQHEGQVAGGKARHGSMVEKVPPSSESGKSRDFAGKAVGVSGKMIDRAAKVIEKGTPELKKAVEEGRMSVSNAAELAEADPQTQKEAAKEAKHTGGRYRNQKPRGSDGDLPKGQYASTAMQYVSMAISQMNRILDKDPDFDKAFDKIEKYIQKRRSGK